VPLGKVVFRVEAAPETDASATPLVEASAPFMHYADGVILEPIVTAMSENHGALTDASLSPAPSYVIIRRGDNLWRIARRNYGRGVKYEAIFAANRDLIRNPHWIFPGQVFVVPTRDRSWETVEQ
jgi:nucleoid-associated protein YgaU